MVRQSACVVDGYSSYFGPAIFDPLRWFIEKYESNFSYDHHSPNTEHLNAFSKFKITNGSPGSSESEAWTPRISARRDWRRPLLETATLIGLIGRCLKECRLIESRFLELRLLERGLIDLRLIERHLIDRLIVRLIVRLIDCRKPYSN